MKNKRIFQALLVGIMSAIAVALTLQFELYTWLLFIAWVSFFIFGKEPKQILFSFIQIVLGMGIGIIMMLEGHFLTNLIGEIGFSIAIILVMTLFIYFIPKLKPINIVPAYFMGIIIFFGTHPNLNVVEIALIVLTVIIGFSFAWATHKLESYLINNIKV